MKDKALRDRGLQQGHRSWFSRLPAQREVILKCVCRWDRETEHSTQLTDYSLVRK